MFILHSFVLEYQLSLSSPKGRSHRFLSPVCILGVTGQCQAQSWRVEASTQMALVLTARHSVARWGTPGVQTLCQLSDELPAPVTEAAAYKA